MRMVMTAADGFLGWHTRVRMRALTHHEVVSVDVANWDSLRELVGSGDAVLHFAGINRASDREVEDGNADLASELADAVKIAPGPPVIVDANRIHAGNGTPYGTGKALASTILGGVSSETSTPSADVVLPNLFSEHGRPDYNSFAAAFAHKVVAGEHPELRVRCVLSDSGALAEESSMLGFPAVPPRESIERPEAPDTACMSMTGLDSTKVVEPGQYSDTQTTGGWRPRDPHRRRRHQLIRTRAQLDSRPILTIGGDGFAMNGAARLISGQPKSGQQQAGSAGQMGKQFLRQE